MLHQKFTVGPLRRRVCIAIPSYGPQESEVGDSLADLQAALVRRGIPYRRARVKQCPYFSHTMNYLIGLFLATPEQDEFFDRILFLDNDIVFKAEDAIRLIESDTECVGADYARKERGAGTVAVRNGLRSGHLEGVVRMGTGFLCASRSLFVRMSSKAERYRWNGVECPRLFADTVVDGEHQGGDVTFYKLLHETNGAAWIDPTIRLGHVGTHAYTPEDACGSGS